MASFGELVLALLMLVITIVINGWGLSVVWNWYMPNLFGLPLLTIFQAVGVSIVIKMFIGTNSTSQKDETKSFPERMLDTTLYSGLVTIVFVSIAYLVRTLAF